MNEKPLKIVREAIRQIDLNHCGYWTFDQMSYTKWAAREILSRLRKNPDASALSVVEEFRDRMDRYSCLNPESSAIFSIAHDTADYIIDLLLADGKEDI